VVLKGLHAHVLSYSKADMNLFNLIIILLSCVFFSHIRHFILLENTEVTKVWLMAIFSAFSTLLITMMVNAAGVNYGFLDEVIISSLYVFIGPHKYLENL
jgi:hypothetical protein